MAILMTKFEGEFVAKEVYLNAFLNVDFKTIGDQTFILVMI